MSRYEKIAWFNLAVFTVSVIVYFILFLYLRTKIDIFLSAQFATPAFGLIALFAIGPMIFRYKSSDYGMADNDRKTTPQQKTGGYRYRVFWVAYVIVFIGIWLWVKYTLHGAIEDQMDVLVMFFSVGVLGMVVFVFHQHLKKQAESGLIIDGQSKADALLYGPDMDERDLMIQKKARWSGFCAFWLCLVVGFVGTWFCLQVMGYRTISLNTNVLPLFLGGAFILIFVVDSITTVILYRRGK